MSESNFYKILKENLIPLNFVLDRIECNSLQGVPDVLYCAKNIKHSFGWIELKYLKSWPVKEETKVKIPHFTKYQRNWIWLHGKATRRVFVFLKVGKDHLIFDHHSVFSLNSCTRGELIQQALCQWYRKIDYKQLKNILLF